MSTRHLGAHQPRGAHRLPARLSPRRTRRWFGLRVTPAAHEGLTVGLGMAAFMVTVLDWDSDPTSWTPYAVELIRHLFG